MYPHVAEEFAKLLDMAGFTERKGRRHKITLKTFRDFVKSTISDCSGKEFSEWFVGYAGSPYYNRKESLRREFDLTGVDNHIGGLGTMFELIAQNQIGKPGYETWINNRVIDVAEILKSAGYNTFMAGKWHLSGPSPFRNGTYPADRGFEKSLTLLGGIPNHFGGAPEAPFDPVQYAGNLTKIPRPLPNSTYSNDLLTK